MPVENDSRLTPAWMAGGGQSGALLRSIDWERSPLGPVGAWPASLRTTIGVLLHSRHPMFLWWGAELIQFYNDAYLPSFGVGKHPAAMGQRGRECWPEIWPIIGPQIEDVMARGIASWNEDQLVPIFRNDRIEEVYWTYGYSPVIDEQDRVGGTLVVCTETTMRVVAARRLQLLSALGEAAQTSGDAASLRHALETVLASAGADLPFLALFPGAEETASPDVLGAPREAALRLVEAGVARGLPELAEACARGLTHRLPGEGLRAGPWPEAVSEIYVAALGRTAPGGARGFAVFGVSPRLPFDKGYRDLFDQLAGRLGAVHERLEATRLRSVVVGERNNLLMQAPIAISILTGPQHVYQLVNPRYRQMIGRDVIGKAYVEAFPEIAGTSLPGILDEVYRTGVAYVSDEYPVTLDRGDGTMEERFFRFNLEAIRDEAGRVYGMMACAMDITAQLRARRAVQGLSDERERLLVELEAASRAKDEFLAMLGHELRNPLSPIVTALRLMKRSGAREHERERELIERHVNHLLRLVDDLLDVSRFTRGKVLLKREVVELGDVLANAVEIASVLLEQRSHALAIDVPRAGLLWEGDPVRLAQVVANLLTNAARYTPPGGHVRLAAHREGDEVVVTVADDGNGIPAELLPRIFELFVQGERHGEIGAGGLGIGLTLAKSLVAMHGGSIGAESAGPGAGSTFVIRLPAPRTLERSTIVPRAPRAAAAAAESQHILVVDDNADAAELLGELLRDSGHEVSVESDPLVALDTFERVRPSVAIVDIGMPVIDGYELAERIRQTDSGRRCRFIALTGYGQDQDHARSLRAGFVSHLVKPSMSTCC